MNAANRRLLIAGFAVILSTTAFTANAQYFSSEGRSGLYREYFLQSVEATGVEDNRIVTVIASDNRGESETSEFVVNCNDTMAQILDGDNLNHQIDVRKEPSSADRLYWELWFSVCRKDSAKLSKRAEIQKRLKTLSGKTELSLKDTPYTVRLQSLDYSKSIANLVRADVQRTGKKGSEKAYVYCDVDSGTVYWKQKKALIGIEQTLAEELNRGVSPELISLSDAVWVEACGRSTTKPVHETASNAASQSKDDHAEESNSSGKSPSASKEARNALSDIYQTYLLVKGFCEYHVAPERQMAPLKAKLKQVDLVAASLSLDTSTIWVDTAKKMEKDDNYKLMQLYKMMPVGFEDRLRFANACKQTGAALNAILDDYLSKYGGVKMSIEKDF